MRGRRNRRVDKLLFILMKVARDKGFERLCKLEKGKVTGRLAVIKKRHGESTKLQTEAMTVHSTTEWGVKSSDGTQIYTVCLEMMTCPFNCKLKCEQCNICVHTYTCSCNDALINHTICKHIHLVARTNRSLTNAHGRISLAYNCGHSQALEDTCTHVVHHHDSEHDSVTPQQGQHRLETIKARMKQKLTALLAQTENCFHAQALLSAESSVDTAASVLHVISTSVHKLTMPSTQQARPNKYLQQQQRFFSTKHKRKTKIRIAKPSHQERRDIQQSLIGDIPLYSGQTTPCPTTPSQTSMSQCVSTYILHVHVHVCIYMYIIIMYHYTRL